MMLQGDHKNKGQKLKDFCDKRIAWRKLPDNELHKEAHLFLSTSDIVYKKTFIKSASVMCTQSTECF